MRIRPACLLYRKVARTACREDEVMPCDSRHSTNDLESPALERRVVAEVLGRWPQTARVFLDRRMACVGCPIAGFETIGEAATAYGQDPGNFVAALRACIHNPTPARGRRS